jgi:hypothetical protein
MFLHAETYATGMEFMEYVQVKRYPELTESLRGEAALNIDERSHKGCCEKVWTSCFRAKLYGTSGSEWKARDNNHLQGGRARHCQPLPPPQFSWI